MVGLRLSMGALKRRAANRVRCLSSQRISETSSRLMTRWINLIHLQGVQAKRQSMQCWRNVRRVVHGYGWVFVFSKTCTETSSCKSVVCAILMSETCHSCEWHVSLMRLAHATLWSLVVDTVCWLDPTLTLAPLCATKIVLVRFISRLTCSHRSYWELNACLNMTICKVGFQDKQIWVIFTHLKLWIAVATHKFKWMTIYFFNARAIGCHQEILRTHIWSFIIEMFDLALSCIF